MPLNRQQARSLALANGAGRSALGAAALAWPGVVLTPWIGAAGDTPAAQLLARAMGARDLALGMGTLLALRRDAAVRGWIEAGGLADAGDVIVTLAAFTSLPRRSRWAVLAAATGGVAAAALAARGADQEDGGPEREPGGSAPGAA